MTTNETKASITRKETRALAYLTEGHKSDIFFRISVISGNWTSKNQESFTGLTFTLLLCIAILSKSRNKSRLQFQSFFIEAAVNNRIE